MGLRADSVGPRVRRPILDGRCEKGKTSIGTSIGDRPIGNSDSDYSASSVVPTQPSGGRIGASESVTKGSKMQ